MATVVSSPGAGPIAAWQDRGYALIRRADVGVHRRTADVVQELLAAGAEVVASRVTIDPPGSPGSPWQRAADGPGLAVVVWHALTDAGLHNGCPWLVPGSHRARAGDHDRDGAIPVTLAPGDVLVLDAGLRHRTTANHSRASRVEVVVRYAAVRVAPDDMVD